MHFIVCNNCYYYTVTLVPSHPQIHGSSITNGQQLCPGQEIVLTCEVTRSLYLTWMNSEYIGGAGDSLRFSVINNTETTLLRSSVYNTTFAVLTSKLLQHGVYQIVSELHITLELMLLVLLLVVWMIEELSTASHFVHNIYQVYFTCIINM